MLNLYSDRFHDQVYGCWMGKNCGGTLGAPLEKAFGEPEPFDVWWYPRLQEGGIPNDDLEMQLIWLKALEEVGPDLRAADLAQYWLDHIGYNWDEYGLSKTNLRLGLLPPVSGNHNNWFKDCMGSPIRSEIWACVAPGAPRIAARYAYEDAICDHAGGESVFSEMCNAALEAAAFLVSDYNRLLDIAMSYVPEWSQTAKAMRAARAAHDEGLDWKEARQRVLEATPHYNAQYSPINMGFQVIGLLYGKDFGDAICKTVNCGYDTDCTGATLGSILGIIAGRDGLPQQWTAPLGEEISTNESWGGLMHTSDGGNPIPSNLNELTERVCKQARLVLAAYHLLDENWQVSTTLADLYADDTIRALWSTSPQQISYEGSSIAVTIDYIDTPVAYPGQEKKLLTHLYNPHPQPLHVHTLLASPLSWQMVPQQQETVINAHSHQTLSWQQLIPGPALLENSNHLSLTVQAKQRPAQPALPIILLGANRYRHAHLHTAGALSARELFDQAFEEEEQQNDVLTPQARNGYWTEFSTRGNALPLPDLLVEAGCIYIQTYLWSDETIATVSSGIPATCPVKAWLNGDLVIAAFDYLPLRPNYGGYGNFYQQVTLKQGWNEVLMKFVHVPAENKAPPAAHFILSDTSNQQSGLEQIGCTRFPWEHV